MITRMDFIALTFFLLSPLLILSQKNIFKTYTVEDGLVSNPVKRIYQDKKGFMWIATTEGLSKYDGHKFTNYTTANGLSHNLINDLYESPDGKLYVAENNGSVDILQHDAIVRKAAFQNVIINQFYVTRDHRVIAATDGNGFYELKNGNFVKPLQSFPRSTYNGFSELNDSLLIGGSESEGLVHILNMRYGSYSEIKQPLMTHRIYKDSKNRTWLCTNDGLELVSYFQKNDQPLSIFLLRAPFKMPDLRKADVADIMEDASGNFWIATTHGLVEIHPDGDWQLFSEKDGLPSPDIACIYQDIEKNIWIGTSFGLAKLITKKDIRIYTLENGLTLNHEGFLQPLFNSTKKKFLFINSPQNFSRGFSQNCQSVLFYGDYTGVGKYDSVHRQIVDYILTGFPYKGVYCSVMDANGIMFNGMRSGLNIFLEKKSYNENKIPYQVSVLLIDKKSYLWVGTFDDGLYRIHYTNTKNKSDSDRISISVKNFSDQLPDKHIRSILEDSKGNIWIGTRRQGIVQLSNNGKEQFTQQRYDLRKGLMSNWIRAIAEDKNGCIWIGSDLGIDKLIPVGKQFQVFNFSQVNNFFADIGAILPENNHSLWFSTNKGLVNIIDDELEKTAPPPLYITSVHLGDTSFNYNTHHREKKVQLKYNQNQAEFEFSAPSFINEKQILYSYHLAGSADTAWSEPASLHTVSYASLQPGNYKFEVRTLGWNGKWGLPATFLFRVRPPYWQTWWFFSLVGLCVLSLLYAFYLYRIRQLMNLQKVRNRIATDLHDDIGATLSSISMYSDAVKEQVKTKLPHLGPVLEKMGENSRSMVASMSDIVWAINPNNDDGEKLLQRMEHYAKDICAVKNIRLQFHVDEKINSLKLTLDQRKNIYLVFKEALNNALKYSGCNMIWINTKISHKQFELNIKDDGKGFDTNNRQGNGLRNMAKRATEIKGEIMIESIEGSGTLIGMHCPIT